MKIPDYDFLVKKPSGRFQEVYIKKNYPEFHDYIINQYPKDLRWLEKLYWYFHNITDYPKCQNCNKRVSFIGIIKGYRSFCSLKCRSNSQIVINKIKQTNLERYGNIWSSCTEKVKERMKKTCLERYGTNCTLHNNIIQKKSKQTKLDRYGDANYTNPEKRKQTKLDRYGDANYTNSEKRKQTKLDRYGDANYTNPEKRKQTCFNRYGGPNPFCSKNIQEKAKSSNIQNFLIKHPEIISINWDINNNIVYKCKCPHSECNKCKEKYFNILSYHYDVRRYNKIELCTNLLPIQYDRISNTSIEIFIQNILDKYNIEYKTNIRDIIPPKELDIYIPSKKIAIECNGCYWHSQKDNKYHYNKYKECKDKGIQLLTFWDDQIINNPNIIESILLSKLGIYKERIYARKCIIKEIDSKTSNNFLRLYHLQGNVNSSIRLGLFYNNDLVSIMTFGKKRKCMNKKDGWELYRYCNKIGIQVIGGASKLFKYFIKKYNPIEVESFSSNDISNGNLYEQLGFQYISTSISYWYIKNNIRYHRYHFRKNILVEHGYDKNKTEFEIMDELGYNRIYDTGQNKWIYKNN